MARVTRRDFLKKSFAAGITLAVASRASSYARILGANDEIHIGVIGFRSKGAQHIKVFHEIPGVRVVALCDVDQEFLMREEQAFKERNESVTTCQDFRKLLENKDIDAVVIATPNHWHSLMGILACQAGKDVYVEKPISHNIWEGRKLVEAARKYNRIVQAGTQNRSDVGFREAVEYMKAGNLGKVLWAHGVWYKEREPIGKVNGPQPVPESVNYDLWVGPAKMQKLMRERLHYDWHWFWEYGSGEMGNLGVHQIDDIRFAVDLPEYPHRVISFGGRFNFDDDGETPNTQVAIFDYETIPVIVEVRNLPREKGQRGVMDHLRGSRMGNIIQCENGYFVGGRGGGWSYDNDGKKLVQFPGDGGGTHQANFIEAMRSRKPDDLRGEVLNGHISSLLCHAANISYQLGKSQKPEEIQALYPGFEQAQETLERIKSHLSKNEVDFSKDPFILGPWLTLDSRQEKFVNDFSQKANQMLKRKKYRKPFVVPENV